VLFVRNKLGGQRILEGFFRADVEAGKDEDQREKRETGGRGGKQNRGHSSQSVARGKNKFAVGNKVADPTTDVSGTCIEDVVDRIEDDRQAGRSRGAMCRTEHTRGVEDQQRVSEVSGPENTYTNKKSPEYAGQSAQAVKERKLLARFDWAFPNQKPEARNGDEAGQQRPQKDSAVVVIRNAQQP